MITKIAPDKNLSGKMVINAVAWLMGFCFMLGGIAFAQTNLEYQKRADRYEGIKPKPVSGFDVELLSAQIAYQDDTRTLGDRYQVRFFLNEARPVHLLVSIAGLQPMSFVISMAYPFTIWVSSRDLIIRNHGRKNM